jgi:hypothetical protein
VARGCKFLMFWLELTEIGLALMNVVQICVSLPTIILTSLVTLVLAVLLPFLAHPNLSKLYSTSAFSINRVAKQNARRARLVGPLGIALAVMPPGSRAPCAPAATSRPWPAEQ